MKTFFLRFTCVINDAAPFVAVRRKRRSLPLVGFPRYVPAAKVTAALEMLILRRIGAEGSSTYYIVFRGARSAFNRPTKSSGGKVRLLPAAISVRQAARGLLAKHSGCIVKE